MATSVQFRPHSRDLGMAMRQVDEDLAIFLGLKNAEKERNDHLPIEDSNKFDYSSSLPDSLVIPKGFEEETVQIVADDDLLNLEAENKMNDYDWLTPETINAQDSATNILRDESIPQKSQVTNSCPNSRPSSSRDRKANSRASTPTRRPSLPAKSKASLASTPTSRATPEHSQTEIRPKPGGAQVRSSTPSTRSSTPSSRPSVSKSGSRSATPTRKPETTQSNITSLNRSSSGRKTSIKNPQMVKSRPTKTSDILSTSQDAPQNPKTSLPKRPASASRGRPSAQATTNSSCSNGKPRQRSCSPAQVRASNGTTRASNGQKIGSAMLSRSRSYNHGSGSDDVNPVLMGTKMVERVVNMRKLAPPKQDEHASLDDPKKASHKNPGFGRSLSKRSLDMAIRHMDIRRSIPDSLRPVATSVLSSSASGSQSSSSQSSTVGFSESPLTSASGSSKSSSCDSSYFL